ncbi:DNA translocase FtsK [Serratia quinivorans]|uniref:DNA translocase FtsK n=1 Tax=Serratia quinivorans TaxID=137545 RepID=UPI0039658CC9
MNDPLYAKAVEFTRLGATIGAARIQMEFKVGYNRAEWLIERMQEEGVATAPAWNGIRTVIHGGSDASK